MRGYRLVLLDRSFDTDHKQFWLATSAQLIETELSSFNERLAVDSVIHAAAITAEPHELGLTPESYLGTSLATNFHMLNWSRVNHVKRFIFVSSAGVFSGSQQAILDETAIPSSKGLYALAKRTTEDLVTNLTEAGHGDFITVRLGNVYGEDERVRGSRPRVSLVQRLLTQALERQALNVPNETARDWTYAGDIADLFAQLLETTAAHRLYHLVSPERFTATEIAHTIKDLLPDVRLDPSDAPLTQLRTPLTSRYLPDLNFSTWTPFDSGLKQVLQAQPGYGVAA